MFAFMLLSLKLMLEGIQRKAIRFIYNEYWLSDSPTELISKAGILTLQNRAKLAQLIFMYQLVHGKTRMNKPNPFLRHKQE